MRVGDHNFPKPATRKNKWLFGLAAFFAIGFGNTALAHTTHHHRVTQLASRHTHVTLASRSSHHSSTRLASSTHHNSYSRLAGNEHHYHHYIRLAAQYRHSYLQCVPYAREVSHIELSGDAFLWWAEASGRYARGDTPVEGAVLNFRAIRRMPLGHVAVVTAVIDSRTVLVTQANWIRGTITNDVTMQDVSPDNDWSQVQVELGDTSTWGAAYPTYGFIYNQPDNGTVIANSAAAQAQSEEVAEAPKAAVIQTDAPDRNLQ